MLFRSRAEILPPIAQALGQAQNLSAFSAAYLWELAGRLVSWHLLLGLAAVFAAYSLARRKLRLSTFVFVGILAVMLTPEANGMDYNQDKVDEITLALLWLTTFKAAGEVRAWKGQDWAW